MARFVPSPDLDERVARVIEPTMQQVMARIHAAVAMSAPDGKYWLSVRDDRVRHSHVEADATLIPENVPYILSKRDGTTEVGDRPRDPALSPENSRNCRCASIPEEGAIASTLEHSVDVSGPRCTGRIEARFPRVAESEFSREGGGWMLGAARDTLAVTNARR